MTQNTPTPTGFWPDGFNPDNYVPQALAPGQAGYLLFSQPTPDVGAVKTQVGAFAPGTTSHVFTGTPNSVQYLYTRAVSACGVADDEPIKPKLRRVAFDALGALIPDVPNAPKAQTVANGPGGTAVLTWKYIARGQATPPAGFNIYVATGANPFNFNTPAGNVAPSIGNSFTSAAFAHGTTVRMVVRAVSSDGDEEPNTIEVETVVDAQAPTAPDDLVVELTA